MTDRSDQAALVWLRAQARGGGFWARLAVAAGCAHIVFTIVQAGLFSWLIHALIIEKRLLSDLNTAYWALPLCIFARAFFSVLKEEAGQRASLHIRQKLRSELLDKFYRLGPAWRNLQQSGGLSTIFQEQVEALDGYYSRYRPQQWLATIAPVLIVLAVMPYSWVAAVILSLTAPLIPLFMVLVGWGAKSRQSRQFQALQRMSGYFLEALRGLPTLRILDAHRRETATVSHIADEFRIRTMSVLRLAFLSGTVLEFFASIAVALSAVYLGFTLLGFIDFGFYGDTLTLQTAFFILLLAPEFYQPLRDLGTHYHARAEALAAVAGLRTVFDGRSLQVSGGDFSPPKTAPAILLDAVDFAYRVDEPVLKKCALAIHAEESIAIVGPSGGGKTTLLRLLLGQISPAQGHIFIDNVPLTRLDQTAWRERIGWMGQHPPLLAASLADNLRVVNTRATDEELKEALEFAALGTWFCNLSNGLETQLGEGGRLLSGGELRRLALARLRLRDAALLLFDEPTASLDEATEAIVIDRINILKVGRTSILLTHRRAPTRLADRVLSLHDGRLWPEIPCEVKNAHA